MSKILSYFSSATTSIVPADQAPSSKSQDVLKPADPTAPAPSRASKPKSTAPRFRIATVAPSTSFSPDPLQVHTAKDKGKGKARDDSDESPAPPGTADSGSHTAISTATQATQGSSGNDASASAAPAPSLPPPAASVTTSQTPSASPSNDTSSPSLPSDTSGTTALPAALAALEATIHSVGTGYTAPLLSRAQDLHNNAAALAQQEQDLLKSTAGLGRETDKLARFAQESAKAARGFKELGNWAAGLEADLEAVEETWRIVDTGDEEPETCEVCRGDLADVGAEGVRWCEGCDGLWHVGCAGEVVGEGEGEADLGGATSADGHDRVPSDGADDVSEAHNDTAPPGVGWRCRDCSLREDMEAIADGLGTFNDFDEPLGGGGLGSSKRVSGQSQLTEGGLGRGGDACRALMMSTNSHLGGEAGPSDGMEGSEAAQARLEGNVKAGAPDGDTEMKL